VGTFAIWGLTALRQQTHVRWVLALAGIALFLGVLYQLWVSYSLVNSDQPGAKSKYKSVQAWVPNRPILDWLKGLAGARFNC